MIQRDSVIPLYYQIGQNLRRRIESGELRPGDRVQSERELAETYGVSLMTARQALMDLEQEGLISRQRGKGSFVEAPKIQINQLMGFYEKMVSRGIRPSSEVLEAECVNARADIAKYLGIDSHSSVYKIRRLRRGDGEPFALETVYFAESLCPGLLEKDLEYRSIYQILQSDYGIALGYADETIEAVLARKGDAELLGTKTNSALMAVKQVLFDPQDRVISYAEALYRADKYHVTVRLMRAKARQKMPVLKEMA